MSVKSIRQGIRIRTAEWLLGGSIGQTVKYGASGFGSVAAAWQKLEENKHYERAFETNVGVSSVIDIKASAKANVKFKIRDINTNETIPLSEFTKEQEHVYNLLKKPNQFQSTFEFWKQFEIFKSVFGNAYIYASYPTGFSKEDPMNVESLTNVWAQYISPVYTGQIFDAAKQTDIVRHYIFNYEKRSRIFETDTIIHRNDVSITLNPLQLTLGTSRLKSLAKPISNIDIAFESRNVLGKKRGALGIFSGAVKDATGAMPLTREQRKEAQSELDKYGTLEGQFQYMLSRFPLTFQKTASSIKDLQLFEEVATDIMHIATKYGVPEILVKAYLQGATFENQEASEKRLYQNAVIPEFDDDMIAINNYFKTNENGFNIDASFDHVPVLQKNRKEASEVNKNQSTIYKELFFAGACTYGQWQKEAGMIREDDMNDKKIWDLTPDQLNIIGINTNTTTNEPS